MGGQWQVPDHVMPWGPSGSLSAGVQQAVRLFSTPCRPLGSHRCGSPPKSTGRRDAQSTGRPDSVSQVSEGAQLVELQCTFVTVTRSTTVLGQSTYCRRGQHRHGRKQRPRRYPLTWEAEGRSFIFIFMWCADPIRSRFGAGKSALRLQWLFI